MNPYILLAAALLLAGTYGTGWLKGHGSAMRDWERTQAKAELEALSSIQRMERKGSEEVVRYVTRTKTITERIQSEPLVVTLEDDSECSLPPDFAGMWNRVNQASNPQSSPDAHASPDTSLLPRIEANGASPSTVGH